jgi:hypothetical protein
MPSLTDPMKDILAELSLAPEICGALTEATPLSQTFKITPAYEAGDWPTLSSIASKVGCLRV